MATYEGVYKIYCITESSWQYAVSTTSLTQCPINGAHTVNPDSSSQVSTGFTVITSSYSMDDDDTLVDFRGTSLLQTITAPTPSYSNYAKSYKIINTGTVAVGVSGVLGLATIPFGTGIQIISNGTNFIQVL